MYVGFYSTCSIMTSLILMRVELIFLLTGGQFQDNAWTNFLKTIADGMTVWVGYTDKKNNEYRAIRKNKIG